MLLLPITYLHSLVLSRVLLFSYGCRCVLAESLVKNNNKENNIACGFSILLFVFDQKHYFINYGFDLIQ